ncbi:kinase-like domain-containing protein [Pyrenochaeta sp. MPI-SDFR-AT-0127]|nr:kinase-like domain-containing protein [Pyrenochaeta sp. MPI-SDFR-AT-0127]
MPSKEYFEGKPSKKNTTEINRLISELQITKRLNHNHLIQYIGRYTSLTWLGLIMSPVADCNLQVYMEENTGTASASLLKSFFGCLASALSYLHGIGVNHNGLKTNAILVHRDNVLISGFGIAHDFSNERSEIMDGPGPRVPKYSAPEAVGAQLRDRSVDIWSLGCIFLEMGTYLLHLSSKWLSRFYAEHGTGSLLYHANLEATRQLLLQLGAASTTEEQEMLLWIKAMLQTSRHFRPTASQIVRRIIGGTRSSSKFCGKCCATVVMESSYQFYPWTSNGIISTDVAPVQVEWGPNEHFTVNIIDPNTTEIDPSPRSSGNTGRFIPKGILKQPTKKFPEGTEIQREGALVPKAPLKGKDAPANARWTRIDRRLVNPEALEEAKERFEERIDYVIVLRVLKKEEIQNLADRTKQIRVMREEGYKHRNQEETHHRVTPESSMSGAHSLLKLLTMQIEGDLSKRIYGIPIV